MKNKPIFFIVTCSLLFFYSLTALGQLSGRKISLDPGHGGTDPGALGASGPPHEKHLCLDGGLELRDRLQSYGATVTMTRTTDWLPSLTARRDHFNHHNPHAAISIHLNAFNGSAHGTETYWSHSGGSGSSTLATRIQSGLIEFMGRANRGVKTANFTVITANVPVCLTEGLFIDNPTEYAYITSANGFNNWVRGHKMGVFDYLNISRPSPVSKGTLIGVIYQNGDTSDRVSGVSVSLNTGQQMTTGSTGVYEFELDPATYTVTASKSGYQTNSRSATVTAGQTTWASMELSPEIPPDSEISNWHQLNDIRNNLSGDYTLMNNLDSSTPGYNDYNSGSGWEPIGTESNTFTGTFNGNGHSISGLNINRSTIDNGLFGHITNASISNVGVVGATITTTQSHTGGLVGRSFGSDIENCYASGSIANATTDAANIGGLVGRLSGGSVSNSWANVNINTSGWLVGGLIGTVTNYDGAGATVEESFATGNISVSNRWIGGLVGQFGGGSTISDSYATGNISGSADQVGGIVGRQWTGSSIIRSYSTGNVSGSADVGGFVGQLDSDHLTNCYWDTQASGTTTGVGSGSSSGLTGRTTGQMKTQTTFNNWNFSSIWGVYNELTYPWLQFETTEIENWNDLDDIRNTKVLHYVLQNNINEGTPGYGGTGNNWSPIGVFGGLSFSGIFNGNEYTISDLMINYDDVDAGLFGYAKDASFLNLGLENIDITTSDDRVGALVGRSDNIVVSNCYSTGNIVSTGRVNAGGLIGYTAGTSFITKSWSSVNIDHNYSEGNAVNTGGLIAAINEGKLSMSFATGSIRGEEDTGGLVGRNYGIIENSYARGNITGSVNRTGGLVGRNANDGSITNSYSTGLVRGESGVGGLIGINETGGSASNSYWDMDVSGQTDSDGGIGRTHTDMKEQNNFSSWNFTSIWDIEGGHSYPFLQWETDTAPIKVTSWADLNNTRNNLGGYYILMNNLDEESSGYGDIGNDWTPIGTDANRFSGLFDGNEYTISGLKIDGDTGVGLFGYARHASFLNTGVWNVDITADGGRVGALIGQTNNDVLVYNCSSTGNITSAGDWNVGGLLGRITDTFVSNSWSSVDIVHTEGDANGNTAGLVGHALGGVTISSSFATGNVEGIDRVGGLVGRLRAESTILNSYARGSATGNEMVGGLVGWNEGTANKSYSTGNVSGNTDDGGFVGLNDGTVEDSFWDTETSGTTSSDGGTGKTTAEMKTESTFTDAGWNFSSIWSIASSINRGYPYLQKIEPDPDSIPEDIVWWRSIAGDGLPAWFDGLNQRGTALITDEENSRMLIQSAPVQSDNVAVYIVNAETGEDTGSMDLSNYSSDGIFHLSDVVVSEDNRIFLANYGRTQEHGFKVYMYENVDDDTPKLVLDDSQRLSEADWELARTITMAGNYTAGTATLYAISDASNQLARYIQSGAGESFGAPEIIALSQDRGSNPTASALKPGRSSFYQTGVGVPVRKYDANGSHLGDISTEVIPTGTSRVQFLGITPDGDEYIGVYHYSGQNAKLVRVPGGDLSEAELLAVTSGLGDVNTFGNGDIFFEYGEEKFTMVIVASGNGIARSEMDAPPAFTKPVAQMIAGASGWRMLSAPIQGATVGDLARQNQVQGIPGLNALYDNPPPDIETYPPNLFTGYQDGQWHAPAHTNDLLEPGRGFIWYLYDNDEGMSRPLPFVLNARGMPSPEEVGLSLGGGSGSFHLLGNPFFEALDIGAIGSWASAGALRSSIVQAWQNDEAGWQEGTGHQGTWIQIGGGHNDNIVPAWQGFMLENENAGSLTIPKSAMSGPQEHPKGSPSTDKHLAFHLKGLDRQSGLRTFDVAHLLFSEAAEEGWDILDATKLAPLSTSYATLSFVGEHEGEPVLKAQESRPLDFEGTLELPLSFDVQQMSGEFTISWKGLEEMGENLNFVLADHETGQRIDLGSREYHTFFYEAESEKALLSEEKEGAPLSVEPLMAKRSESGEKMQPRFTLEVIGGPLSGDLKADVPEQLELAQNYPNPFNPVTVLSYGLPEEGRVSLTIYDITGRLVTLLVDEHHAPGRYEVSWDATRQASGVYIYRLEVGGETLTRRMTLIK